MYKFLSYLKYLGLFCLIIIGIALITSLIHLTGLNSSFLNKLSIIITAISFFIVSCLAAQKTEEKGVILGLKLALMFVMFLVITNLIIFHSSFSVARFIYYAILILSGILGGSFGKNIKKEKK